MWIQCLKSLPWHIAPPHLGRFRQENFRLLYNTKGRFKLHKAALAGRFRMRGSGYLVRGGGGGGGGGGMSRAFLVSEIGRLQCTTHITI